MGRSLLPTWRLSTPAAKRKWAMSASRVCASSARPRRRARESASDLSMYDGILRCKEAFICRSYLGSERGIMKPN